MCTRDLVDKKNMEKIKSICEGYPDLVMMYITGLAKKTTYTKRSYAYYVCRFLKFMKERLKLNINDTNSFKSIKPMDIDLYIEENKTEENGKEKSATYLNAQFAAIHGFFKFLKRNGYVDDDPCLDTEVPKDNRIHEITVIDSNDMKIIMDNISNGVGTNRAKRTQEKWISRDRLFVALGVSTGLRLSAIVGLDLGDINFEDRSIVVTEKGRVERKVYFGESTEGLLKAWINDRSKMNVVDSKALFIAQGGRRMATRTAQDLMKRITNGTTAHITPHKMRATCATRLYDATGDIYRVQSQLGHKNIQNTQRYAKVSEAKRRESADILDNII